MTESINVSNQATWAITYDNDVGPDDEGFWEWWSVTDGKRSFKCDTEADAEFLRDALLALVQPEPAGLGPLWPNGDGSRGDLPADEDHCASISFPAPVAGLRLKVPQNIIDQIGRYGVLRGNTFSLDTQYEWERLIVEIGTWGYGLTRAQSSSKGDEGMQHE